VNTKALAAIRPTNPPAADVALTRHSARTNPASAGFFVSGCCVKPSTSWRARCTGHESSAFRLACVPVRAVNDDAMETRFACNALLRPSHSLIATMAEPGITNQRDTHHGHEPLDPLDHRASPLPPSGPPLRRHGLHRLLRRRDVGGAATPRRSRHHPRPRSRHPRLLDDHASRSTTTPELSDAVAFVCGVTHLQACLWQARSES
jgi:hypothetical protein